MLYPWIHILITHRKLFLYAKLALFVCLTRFQSDRDYSKLNECFARAHFILWMAANCGVAVSFTVYSAFAFQNQSTFEWANKSLVYLCYVMFFLKKTRWFWIENWFSITTMQSSGTIHCLASCPDCKTLFFPQLSNTDPTTHTLTWYILTTVTGRKKQKKSHYGVKTIVTLVHLLKWNAMCLIPSSPEYIPAEGHKHLAKQSIIDSLGWNLSQIPKPRLKWCL